VDELRQILGTDVENIQRKKNRLSNDKSDGTIKDLKDDVALTDEIVYKDSSTFLKVYTCIIKSYLFVISKKYYTFKTI
jgi:mRNA (2'-O-methyladenosine-N6-)-methyltransferase